MKVRNVIALILLTLVLLYAGFVTADSIRLYHADPGTKPLVTLAEEKGESLEVYQGPGYSISYHVYSEETHPSEDEIMIELSYCGAEFRLFGMLLWAWIE